HSSLSLILLMLLSILSLFYFFFFNTTAPTEIYTLSLHDALPISAYDGVVLLDLSNISATEKEFFQTSIQDPVKSDAGSQLFDPRSEEHTSELQSRFDLVCRLLLEKKKKKNNNLNIIIK